MTAQEFLGRHRPGQLPTAAGPVRPVIVIPSSPPQEESALLEALQASQPAFPGSNYLQAISILAGVAIFIIGCIAAGGAIPPVAAGWSIVGLGAAAGLAGIPVLIKSGQKAIAVILALLAAGYLAVGVCGGIGVLTAPQLGWSVLGIAGGFVVLTIGTCCCVVCCKGAAAAAAAAAAAEQKAAAQQVANRQTTEQLFREVESMPQVPPPRDHPRSSPRVEELPS